MVGHASAPELITGRMILLEFLVGLFWPSECGLNVFIYLAKLALGHVVAGESLAHEIGLLRSCHNFRRHFFVQSSDRSLIFAGGMGLVCESSAVRLTRSVPVL